MAALGDDATAAAAVQARGDAYDAELVALDAEIDDLLADLPDRQLVTDHDAFAYFADRYDLEVVGTVIPSFDSSAEVSAGDLDDLAATIRRTGTRAIFTEQHRHPQRPLHVGHRERVDEEVGHGSATMTASPASARAFQIASSISTEPSSV